MRHDGSLRRNVPLHIDGDTFRRLGHELVDRVADHFETLRDRPVTSAADAQTIRERIRAGASIPETGEDPQSLLTEAADVLFAHSLFNAHPRFFGYITSSPAPIGVLGDLLASAVNPNCGAWTLSPVASEIERQTVRWIAELLGCPETSNGLLVSGGNMANIVAFLAARARAAGWDVRAAGLRADGARPLRAYGSAEMHTWIQKAADLSGMGTGAVRWIPVDGDQRMDVSELRRRVRADLAAGDQPVCIVATAGSVSTGAIDPIADIADVCAEFGIWFHVDGAYGGFAAAVPSQVARFEGLDRADSIAVDPHKWLYSPLEAGCTLVRDIDALRAAFSWHPPYYNFAAAEVNFVDLGPQNSRGFRALKVWLALRQAGRTGAIRMIEDDIALAGRLHAAVAAHPSFEALTLSLSISTFRFVPETLQGRTTEPEIGEYLDRLNDELLSVLERSGEVFVSRAIVNGRSALRACIVNFNTTEADVDATPAIIAGYGNAVHEGLRTP